MAMFRERCNRIHPPLIPACRAKTTMAPNGYSRSRYGDRVLFTHAGDDHRLAINKAGAADTASVILQSGWSGRTELGLAGDDDFRLKVSADRAA